MAFGATPIGTRFFGTGAPASLPAPGSWTGYDAVDTGTGKIYICTGTAWSEIGNINTTNLGLLALTGGTMSGSILGATGWAPSDSPNFTSSAKLGGVDLVTADTLASTKDTILNSISPKITEAVASTTSAIDVKSNMAMAMGFLFPIGTTKTEGQTDTIPLPTYPGGATAAPSECVWTVGIYSIPDNGNGLKKILTTNPGNGLSYTCDCYLDAGNWTGHAVLQYMIIGVKS